MFAAAAFAQTSETMTIKLYFLNQKDDPNIEDCLAVKPVDRVIPKTAGVARAALEEYLKGVTKDDEEKGFVSISADETAGALKSIKIKKGVAYVNFNAVVIQKMGTVTTSCGSGFFTGLEKTLTQFPTIKKVFYAIEGDPREFYDWIQVGECPKELKNCDKSNF